MIENGHTLGLSGFTPAGVPKSVTAEVAKKAHAEHEAGRPFKVNILTGASTGQSCDGMLANEQAIGLRAPSPTSASTSTSTRSATPTSTSAIWPPRCARATCPARTGESSRLATWRFTAPRHTSSSPPPAASAPPCAAWLRRASSWSSTPSTARRARVCTMSMRSSITPIAHPSTSRSPTTASVSPTWKWMPIESWASLSAISPMRHVPSRIPTPSRRRLVRTWPTSLCRTCARARYLPPS